MSLVIYATTSHPSCFVIHFVRSDPALQVMGGFRQVTYHLKCYHGVERARACFNFTPSFGSENDHPI